MPALSKFDCFVENLAEKVHDLGADALTVALTNSAPIASNTVLANITEIAYTNLSTRVLSKTSSAQTAGVYKLVLADLVLTATGAVGPFRYVVVYNDTPTSPVDPLIGWYDYGSSISLAANETLTLDFDPTNGAIQLT